MAGPENSCSSTPIWVRPAGNVTFAFCGSAPFSTRSAAPRRIELASPGARGFCTKQFFPERPLEYSSGLFDFRHRPSLNEHCSLKMAKALNLDVPAKIIAIADEVIE